MLSPEGPIPRCCFFVPSPRGSSSFFPAYNKISKTCTGITTGCCVCRVCNEVKADGALREMYRTGGFVTIILQYIIVKISQVCKGEEILLYS